MSCVINIMIQFDGATKWPDHGDWPDSDHDKVTIIDEITTRLCHQRFEDLSWDNRRGWGGEKYPECELLAAAFNYFPLDEFFEEIAKLPWKEPELVRVFVQTEGSDVFAVWVLKDGKMICALPGYGL